MSTTLTYRYAVADLKNGLKITYPDAEIPSANVVFWVRVAENFIRQRTLRVVATGSYLNEYYGPNAIPVNTDGIKKWISLPANIYDLSFEKGIDYISYNQTGTPFNQNIRFTQTDLNVVDQLYLSPHETPTPSNPYFYRVGSNIFLTGIENVSVPNVNIGIYASLDPRPVLLPIDTPLSINDEQYLTLRDMVMGLGKFTLLVPSNRVEAGTDERNENAREFAKNTASQQPQE